MKVIKINIIFFILLLSNCSLIFSQVNFPDPPELLAASVVPDSEPTTVRITWIPSDSSSVAGYIIYKVIGGVTQTIGEVNGRFITSFDYSPSQANIAPESFRLAAFDTLFFKSSITDPHKTVHLRAEFDKCNMSATLNWTAYEGWSTGISKYRIYRKDDSSSLYTLLAEVDNSKLKYTNTELLPNKNYYYYIEAINANGTKANSNSVKVETTAYLPPDFCYAQFATVENSQIKVKFLIGNNTQDVSEYYIQRTTNPNQSWINVGSYLNSGQREIIFTDNNAEPDKNIYYYRIAAVNPCGNISLTSNYASNILLSLNNENGLNHSLSWSSYQNWENGVLNYRIFRYFDGTAVEIAVTNPGDLSYNYDIGWYVNYCHDKKIYLTNKFCYYIEAYENLGHSYSTVQGISRSNVECVFHEPVVWLPNAFNVSSLENENRFFAPVISFVKDEPYEFIIYDKWGNVVFKTNKPSEGWDGFINFTTLAPSQVYVYYIRYFDYKNKEYIRTGKFNLFSY